MDEELYRGYIIVADDMDEAAMGRMAEALHAARPDITWTVRAPQTGEAAGTYGKDDGDGRLPQILGYTIPVPETISQAIDAAWEATWA